MALKATIDAIVATLLPKYRQLLLNYTDATHYLHIPSHPELSTTALEQIAAANDLATLAYVRSKDTTRETASQRYIGQAVVHYWHNERPADIKVIPGENLIGSIRKLKVEPIRAMEWQGTSEGVRKAVGLDPTETQAMLARELVHYAPADSWHWPYLDGLHAIGLSRPNNGEPRAVIPGDIPEADYKMLLGRNEDFVRFAMVHEPQLFEHLIAVLDTAMKKTFSATGKKLRNEMATYFKSSSTVFMRDYITALAESEDREVSKWQLAKCLLCRASLPVVNKLSPATMQMLVGRYASQLAAITNIEFMSTYLHTLREGNEFVEVYPGMTYDKERKEYKFGEQTFTHWTLFDELKRLAARVLASGPENLLLNPITRHATLQTLKLCDIVEETTTPSIPVDDLKVLGEAKLSSIYMCLSQIPVLQTEYLAYRQSLLKMHSTYLIATFLRGYNPTEDDF